MPFDVQAAKKSGYSDAEIADYLAKDSGFDAAGARKAGYSDAEIVSHLTASAQPAPAKAPQPVQTKAPTERGAVKLSGDSGIAGIDLPEWAQKGLKLARGFVQGAADPTVGAAQLGAHLTGAGEAADKAIRENEAKQAALGTSGGARIVGNIASPVNMFVGARVLRPGMTTAQLARSGAVLGGVSGLTAPVVEGGDYTTQKGAQALAGTVTGAIASPAIGAATNGLARAVNSVIQRVRAPNPQQASAQASSIVDEWVRNSVNIPEMQGFDLSQIPRSVLDGVKAKVAQSIQSGRPIVDAGALLRAADFEAAGLTGAAGPTSGQLSRAPTAWAQERNLAQIANGGEPLANKFNAQSTRLRDLFDTKGATRAAEPDVAGTRLSEMLVQSDAPRKATVSKAYGLARGTDGRYADVDVPGFSQAANDALDSQQLGRFLPDRVRALLNDISSGKTPLNVNTLTQTDSVLSEAQRAAARTGDSAAAKAVGVVRDALNNANIVDSAGQRSKAVFDAARNMARERFQRIESSPALKAALDGADPDSFVRKYVLGATTKDARALSDELSWNPEAADLVRSQIAAHLKKAAFGADAAGDGGFAVARYNNALNAIGTNKLGAFFSPEEIAQLKAAGRVMAYIGQRPAGAVDNTSGTAGAVFNLLNDLSGKVGNFPGINIATDSYRRYSNSVAANAAARGEVPAYMRDIPESVRQKLRVAPGAGTVALSSLLLGPSDRK